MKSLNADGQHVASLKHNTTTAAVAVNKTTASALQLLFYIAVTLITLHWSDKNKLMKYFIT